MNKTNKFQVLDIKGDCFEILIASFCYWLKGEYRFLFCECLGFEFVAKNKYIGEKFKVKKGDIVEHAIRNGLEIKSYMNLDTFELKTLLRESHLLIIEFDAFDCYWRNSYEKVHDSHYIVVWKWGENDSLICIDTFPQKDNLQIKCTFAVNIARRIISICEDEKRNGVYSPYECIEKLVSFLNHFSDYGMLNEMKRFVQELPETIHLKDETDGCENLDVFYIPIIANLKKLSWSYYQFKNLLSYIANEKLDVCNYLSDEIIRELEITTNYIILRILRKENVFSAHEIKKHLGKVVCKEENLEKNLLAYCESYENISHNSCVQ